MTRTIKPDYWTGLYREGWGQDIVPEAYAHPAKYARALIRKIYAHAVDQGWLKPGDLVLDPFGGVALGGLDASYHGAHWVGVELEQHFVDRGAGCDCTGISKADWVRFFGRWERARYLDGRHWCPACLAQAKQVADPDPQLALFGGRETGAAYVRNSGRIPETLPHRYGGNAGQWRRLGFSGSVTLLQGDSRRLLAVVQEARLTVSSPPYSSNTMHGRSGPFDVALFDRTPGPNGQIFTCADYGSAPGQLGAMREGDHRASLAVSSPPYADGCRQQGTDRHPERLEGTAFASARYDLAVSSPPWGAGAEGGLRAEKFKDPEAFARAMAAQDGQGTRHAATPESRLAQMERDAGTGYGSEPGNLGNLPATDGDHRAALAVSSPPFGETQSGGGLSLPEARYLDGTRIGCNCGFQNQGTTPGNLASMTVSSPPYAGSQVQQSHGQSWREELTEAPGSWRDLGTGYGATPGQLGTMPEGEPGASLTVSSPPYEESVNAHDCGIDWSKMGPATGNRRRGPGSQHEATLQAQLNYNPSAGNLGAEERDTFWTAARVILEQVYQALQPGGHAIWVVKAFVRDGAVEDFPGQWRALCEAVGFVTLHEHRAMLVEDHGAQLDLEGNHVKRQVARKSFFRRIYEQKYPANRIDFEVVYCMEKPETFR